MLFLYSLGVTMMLIGSPVLLVCILCYKPYYTSDEVVATGLIATLITGAGVVLWIAYQVGKLWM